MQQVFHGCLFKKATKPVRFLVMSFIYRTKVVRDHGILGDYFIMFMKWYEKECPKIFMVHNLFCSVYIKVPKTLQ